MWCPICKLNHPESRLKCPLYNKTFSFQTKNPIKDFESFSSPDIFIGRYNYPNIFSGVLSPINDESDPRILSFPEEWFKNTLSINQILNNRSKLVYSRFKKDSSKRLTQNMQELTISTRPCSAEFNLEKSPNFKTISSFNSGVIANSAPVKKISITSNPKVPKKVDKVLTDTDLLASKAISKLYSSDLPNSYLINLLSAGLLGLKKSRRLVPSRWSTTAVDDILSKDLLKSVKSYNTIDDFKVYTGYYLGNKYVVILMPSIWSFEVLEVKANNTKAVWQDFESFFKRKKYASNVTGAYYANRLAVCEYLTNIRKQAAVLFLREIDESYYAPLGVGILRELSRQVFKNKSYSFQSLNQSLNFASKLLTNPIDFFIKNSQLIRFKKSQKTLSEF